MNNAPNRSVINLRSLAGSLALLLAATLIAGAAAGAALHLATAAEHDRRQAVTQQQETRNRLARAHVDEREIHDKIVRYQAIISLGRTQPERRLEWVETLGNIKTARRLLGLDYEIAPQRPLDEKNIAAGGYGFLASPMKLEMPLLHENDLLGLLADLSPQVQALVSVNSCRIERLPIDPNVANPANLKAACDIDWITLRENGGLEKASLQAGRN